MKRYLSLLLLISSPLGLLGMNAKAPQQLPPAATQQLLTPADIKEATLALLQQKAQEAVANCDRAITEQDKVVKKQSGDLADLRADLDAYVRAYQLEKAQRERKIALAEGTLNQMLNELKRLKRSRDDTAAQYDGMTRRALEDEPEDDGVPIRKDELKGYSVANGSPQHTASSVTFQAVTVTAGALYTVGTYASAALRAATERLSSHGAPSSDTGIEVRLSADAVLGAGEPIVPEE